MAEVASKHAFTSAKSDSADATLVQPSNWNADHVYSGGTKGDILLRDTAATNGASWLASVSTGQVLVSGGAGSLPAFSASPSLTTLTLATSLTIDGNTLNGTEFAALDGITAGTVTASKAVIVDADKDISSFRTLTAVNLKASGLTSGRVPVAGTGGLLGDSANLTWDGSYLSAASIKDAALTNGRVTYAGASGLLQDSAAFTFDGTTLTSPAYALSGNISSAAWTTTGIRLRGAAATLTDTSSSGTVAAAYTDKLGGNTIAASSSTTFTDYATLDIEPPVVGTNVAITNPYALRLGGGLKQVGGVTSFAPASVTGSATTSGLTVAQTWNTSGVVDGAVRIAITDTASGANSLPFAIYGGASGATSLFKVDKRGIGTFDGAVTFGGITNSFPSIAFRAANGLEILSGAGTSRFNDASTAASGTLADRGLFSISMDAAPTLTATNSSVTYTNASTLYIPGAPVAGSNVTIGKALALKVGAGDTSLGGNLGVGLTQPGSRIHTYSSSPQGANIKIDNGQASSYDGVVFARSGVEQWFTGIDGSNTNKDFILSRGGGAAVPFRVSYSTNAASFYYDLSREGANGQKSTVSQATVLSGAMSGATLTLSNLIPAGSLVLGVTVHPTTAITSGDGATTYTVGDGSTADKFATGIAFASDINLTNTNLSSPAYYKAATNVVLTCTGGTFNAGVVRVTVHFITLKASTS